MSLIEISIATCASPERHYILELVNRSVVAIDETQLPVSATIGFPRRDPRVGWVLYPAAQ
jgi:hypothetical protein